MNVIVVDGEQRSALAVTRSLGRRGIKVIVGAEKIPSIASCSKYCSRSFQYPSPYENPRAFLQSIRKTTSGLADAILLPVTDVTISEILRGSSEFDTKVKIPIVGYNQFALASDKSSLFVLARDLGIPVPTTVFSHEHSDTRSILAKARNLGYPLVIKPAQSRFRTHDGWVKTKVRYAESESKLENLLTDEPFKSYPFLIQEKIEGPGMGVFLLVHEEEILAQFAHRRIREKPPSGGVSVVCESIAVPFRALEASMRLLKHLNWYGVAMVEFKWDKRDNLPKLMEINPRFWGSLQLAVSAGVDFPYLLYRLATGERVKVQKDYKKGLKLRWELGDLDHLLMRTFKSDLSLSLPSDAPSRRSIMKDFLLDSFNSTVEREVCKSEDPMPFVFELKQYMRSLLD